KCGNLDCIISGSGGLRSKTRSVLGIFFRKLFRSQQSINTLINENGELNDNKQTNSEIYEFYKKLYESKPMEEEEMSLFLSKLTNKLTTKERESLDQEITIDEITKAMQNNKAPGLDGLPKEYYVTFWELLKGPLLLVYKEAFKEGILPNTMNQGMISLLYKKGPQTDLKNWRPLTLLGVDIKILSKALFFRLKTVISNIIEKEQTCGIPGRKMTDSLALIRDTYTYCQERKLPLSILGIDLEKAFDSVNHRFLEEILRHFNFGSGFIKWIKILYNECSSVVVVNRKATPPFTIKAGVRQGCPLSPLLFILAMEPLACAIRHNEAIKGIIPPGNYGKDIKLTMYMDDLTLLLPDNNSIQESLKISERFTAASGMKINKNKSEILCSNWKESRENWGLIEKGDTIKVLGSPLPDFVFGLKQSKMDHSEYGNGTDLMDLIRLLL
uniref:Reverse transcriptase domain-containing protein n=1 Tax=Xiphophorus maculatus TaxID=8083 RepID=A0A3B5PWS7_XIPMA